MSKITPDLIAVPEGEGGLSIGQIFGLIAGGRRVIALLVAVFVTIAVLISVFGVREYRTAFVAMSAPTADDPTRQTGISVGILGQQTKTPDWEMYLALLTSNEMAKRLIATTDILQRLFPKQWDAVEKRWITEPGFEARGMGGKVKWLLGIRTVRAPDVDTLQGYLQDRLSVQPVAGSSLISISIDSADPDTSIVLLRALHKSANDIVREKRLERSVAQKRHLLEELTTTTVSDYRQVLLDLLRRVETTVMTASMGGQYASVVVDGPVTQSRPVFPAPVLFIEMGIAGGVVLGLFLVVFLPVSDEKLMAFLYRLRTRRRSLSTDF